MEKLEQSLLEKDRDIRIKFMELEKTIKSQEKYSDEKSEDLINLTLNQFYASEEYKAKNPESRNLPKEILDMRYEAIENYRNKCTLLTDFYDNSKYYTMYLIGVEVDYGIVLYMIYDFDLPDDFYLKIPMKIKVVDSTTSYSTIVDVDSKMTDTTVPYRNLESFDEIIIDFFLGYYDDMTKVGTFYQNNYYDYFYNYINYTDIKIDWDNIRDNKNNRINYTIN